MHENKPLTGYPSIDKPWLKYYSKETINSPLPECTIYEYLINNNHDYPNDIALLYMGRRITYGELFEKIDQTAAALSALDVKPGEIVTVALPSIPEALYLVYALNKIGAVANMIHPLAGDKEIVNYLNEVQSRVAILFDGTYQIISNVIGQTSVKHAVVVSAGESLPFGIQQLYFLKNPRPKLAENSVFQYWNAFLRNGKGIKIPKRKKEYKTLALISHTGGTTGEPKGVMCSDYNINALIWQIGCNLPHVRQEKYMVVLPPFINYSLINAMLEPLAFGFQVVLIPDYKPELFVDYVRKYRPNHISSIPPYWEALLSSREIKNGDFASLNHIYYGGEAMPPETEQAINELLLTNGAQHKLCKGIGQTEMMSAATVTYDECNVLESVGIPLVKVNCAIKPLHEDKECGYGEKGEICFSGPTLMMGYYHNQEETDDIIKVHKDGERWLHTGDIGYFNEDGILFITGRIKRILITKGKDGVSTKLFPDRVEKVINQHPDVSLCCVIGVPDQVRVHYPKAFIVLKKGVTTSKVLNDEILELCQDKLPDYMVPDEIEFCHDLPRTPRGKVDYRALERITEAETNK